MRTCNSKANFMSVAHEFDQLCHLCWALAQRLKIKTNFILLRLSIPTGPLNLARTSVITSQPVDKNVKFKVYKKCIF